MATSPRKHTVPAPGETPRRQSINDLAASINDVVPVANPTERAQLLADLAASTPPYVPSLARPLTIWRQDTRTVEKHDGTGWFDYSGIIRSRDVTITASGSLDGSVDAAEAQTLPAAPFGASPYLVRVTAAIRILVPAGRGGLLELLYDGTSYAEDRFSNGGSSQCTYTLKATIARTITDQSAHTLRVRVTSLAGGITVQNVGYWLIEAQPRTAL